MASSTPRTAKTAARGEGPGALREGKGEMPGAPGPSPAGLTQTMDGTDLELDSFPILFEHRSVHSPAVSPWFLDVS